MNNQRNPNLIARTVDDIEDHPHDERFHSNTSVGGGGRSLASHSTYAKKEPTIFGSSAAPKRTAQKAPSTEPDTKLSGIPSSSSSCLPPLGDLKQKRSWQTSGDPKLLLGMWPDFSRLHDYLPPGFDDVKTSSKDHHHAHSASLSGKYDDAPDALANALEEITIDSRFPTLISSLENPSDLFSGTRASNAVSNRSETLGSLGNPRPGNPRSTLNERYQKKYNRSFTKKDFVTIRDSSDGDHIPLFTSMFVCPETGECFLSGNLQEGDLVIDREGKKWYKKKSTAEFAAAGRAEDCFVFRSAEVDRNQFCHEVPFLKRTKKEEEEEIVAFSGLRACDANARDQLKCLLSKRCGK